MEYTAHITFDCPTENVAPETVAELAVNHIARKGITVLAVSVDTDRNPDAPNEAWMYEPDDGTDPWDGGTRPIRSLSN